MELGHRSRVVVVAAEAHPDGQDIPELAAFEARPRHLVGTQQWALRQEVQLVLCRNRAGDLVEVHVGQQLLLVQKCGLVAWRKHPEVVGQPQKDRGAVPF